MSGLGESLLHMRLAFCTLVLCTGLSLLEHDKELITCPHPERRWLDPVLLIAESPEISSLVASYANSSHLLHPVAGVACAPPISFRPYQSVFSTEDKLQYL